MTTEINYVAKTTFKYGGVEYHRGDVVKPVGGKWDGKIFCDNSRFVYMQPVEKKAPARKRKSGGTQDAS